MDKLNNFIIHAYKLEGNGHGERVPPEAILEALHHDDLAWVHLEAENPQTREWLHSDSVQLDAIAIDALLSDETRPRLFEHNDGCMIILRGVNLNPGADVEDMVSIRLWVEKHRIISVQRRSLKTVEDLCHRLDTGKGPKHSGEFLTHLTSRLFDHMTPVLTSLSETMDNVEERIVASGDFGDREDIVSTRMTAIMLRRYLAPQRDVIAQLRASELTWLTDLNKRALLEGYNTVMRHIEDLDALRERAQIVKDELTASLSERMNKNMYVLSVIAAIFLPLGFLTGLLGINIGGIPGADNRMAFSLFCLFLVILVVIQIYIFKRKKWI